MAAGRESVEISRKLPQDSRQWRGSPGSLWKQSRVLSELILSGAWPIGLSGCSVLFVLNCMHSRHHSPLLFVTIYLMD